MMIVGPCNDSRSTQWQQQVCAMMTEGALQFLTPTAAFAIVQPFLQRCVMFMLALWWQHLILELINLALLLFLCSRASCPCKCTCIDVSSLLPALPCQYAMVLCTCALSYYMLWAEKKKNALGLAAVAYQPHLQVGHILHVGCRSRKFSNWITAHSMYTREGIFDDPYPAVIVTLA
jgi:hypothetical protein